MDQMLFGYFPKNQNGSPEPFLAGKAGFPSRCLSGLLLLICTVWTTLFSDAQMTRIVWSTFLLLYLQNLQISQLGLSMTILLCLVHVYTCHSPPSFFIFHCTRLQITEQCITKQLSQQLLYRWLI